MPCVGNDAASKLFDEFCLSIVTGDDLVPRLSLSSCEVLKRDVKRLLEKCNLPKYKIFASAIGNHLACFSNPENRQTLLQRTQNGAFPDSQNPELQENEIKRIIESTGHLPKRWSEDGITPILHSAHHSAEFSRLYIPGRILYIEKVRISSPVLAKSLSVTQEEAIKAGGRRKRGMQSLKHMTSLIQERLIIAKYQSFDSKYVYTPRWATKEEFSEIVVSRTMIRDHTAVFGIMREFEAMSPAIALKVLS